MKSCRFSGSLVLGGVVVLLASCLNSKNPLSAPETAKVDADLAGVWRAKMNNGDVDYYHLGKGGCVLPAGVMRAVNIQHSKDGTLSRPNELLLFATTIGENRYLNIADIDPKYLGQLYSDRWNPALVSRYFILRYRVQGNTLNVWPGVMQAQRKAIQSSKVKGNFGVDHAQFTDSSEHLVSLLSAPENANLFEKEPIKYERVK